MDNDSAVPNRTESGRPEPLHAHSLSASLSVYDLQRSVTWYRAGFGFEVDQEHARGGVVFAVSLRAGAVRILLAQDNGEKGLDRAKGEGFSLMLTTHQDIDVLARQVQALGTVLDSEPTDTPWGRRMFRVRDPDGFLLVLSSEAESRPA